MRGGEGGRIKSRKDANASLAGKIAGCHPSPPPRNGSKSMNLRRMPSFLFLFDGSTAIVGDDTRPYIIPVKGRDFIVFPFQPKWLKVIKSEGKKKSSHFVLSKK